MALEMAGTQPTLGMGLYSVYSVMRGNQSSEERACERVVGLLALSAVSRAGARHDACVRAGRRTVKSKFPLAGMFLRPATPSNSLPESPHNSQTRLSPLPEALYDRQCFKRAAASTIGPAPTENFGAAFEAIPATALKHCRS